MRPAIAAATAVLVTSLCFAQQPPSPEAQEEAPTGFAWLERFVGEWSTAYNGTMTSRAVGKVWVVNEIRVMGVDSVQTIGYDAETDEFLGNWVDSTSTYLWRYIGSLDESGKVLTLETEGPDFSDLTKMRQYRDIYEFKSANEILAESRMQNDDGEWQTFNRGPRTRKSE